MFGLENIKAWIIATILKDQTYAGIETVAPRRGRKKRIDNPPVFIDHYKENFTAEDWEIDRKVHQAIANVKAGLEPEE